VHLFAGDRLGRVAFAIKNRSDAGQVLLLVFQSVGEATFFICVGGDAETSVIATRPSAAAHEALRRLIAGADDALLRQTRDVQLEALGRRTFDALPSSVRERILRASTIIAIPDFSAGQDRIPIELMHDGSAFLGVSRVISRCLSLSHALRVLEPPLVPVVPGQRALCISVASPPGFPELRFADAEIGSLRDVLYPEWDAECLSGSQVNPSDVLELAPLTNVLHVACHGDASAGSEALVMGDGARLKALDIATRHRLRCLTYLNACSLGSGRYVGGGVSRGVAYAFARAGSPAVLSNILPIEDEYAAALAASFYLEAHKHDIGEALRRARRHLAERVSAAHWSTTVLIGNPFQQLNGQIPEYVDQTALMFAGAPLPTPERLQMARSWSAKHPEDARVAAAIEFSLALDDANAPQLESAAETAREIGHDIGEAHCLAALVDAYRDAGDPAKLADTLRREVAALAPLRGAWGPAHTSHREARAKLDTLDPTFEPRSLQTFRFKSGMTVNDRSDPVVDRFLRIQEAMDEHEHHWRGEPRLIVPDLDADSLAHNAVVWGFIYDLHGNGAEAAYAWKLAERIAWRGLLPHEATPNTQRILAGLLHFLWGKQRVTHLDSWMAQAHTEVTRIAITRVAMAWQPPESSPALAFKHEITGALDRLATPPTSSSHFARARSALVADVSPTAPADDAMALVNNAVARCGAIDPFCGGGSCGMDSGRLARTN
jgi:CHAT domain-containing protein